MELQVNRPFSDAGAAKSTDLKQGDTAPVLDEAKLREFFQNRIEGTHSAEFTSALLAWSLNNPKLGAKKVYEAIKSKNLNEMYADL